MLMKKDHYIDPDLFNLCLIASIYKDYIKQHLRAEQIDSVDISLYLFLNAVEYLFDE